ncbi:MAG TPA: MotA/TolQ/ExbB proton channel family protein [Gemmataceae bacterium]|nr:MotA/TolQ/ExbB proton channel family protein [Gemmataceae bacterium]
MALTPSQRPTREWPLLLLTLALVGFICFPLAQSVLPGDHSSSQWAGWDAERWGRLLLGPEQIACYCCCLWACLILLSRYLEVRRQRQAFSLPLLPTEEGSRILHEDARRLQRGLDSVVAKRGPFYLANMIRVTLGKFASSRSSQGLGDTVKAQAEVDQGRLVATMATVHYLAWAIPALGFLGTVRGLAGSLTMTGHVDQDTQTFIEQATRHLTVAFDCTLVALSLSLVVMFLVHSVQRDEEALIIDCQQYCQEHLVNRTYEPETLGEDDSMMSGSRDRIDVKPLSTGYPKRITL